MVMCNAFSFFLLPFFIHSLENEEPPCPGSQVIWGTVTPWGWLTSCIPITGGNKQCGGMLGGPTLHITLPFKLAGLLPAAYFALSYDNINGDI